VHLLLRTDLRIIHSAPNLLPSNALECFTMLRVAETTLKLTHYGQNKRQNQSRLRSRLSLAEDACCSGKQIQQAAGPRCLQDPGPGSIAAEGAEASGAIGGTFFWGLLAKRVFAFATGRPIIRAAQFIPSPSESAPMEPRTRMLTVRLKDLGFTQGSQMKLYGESFEVASEPMVLTDDLVLVDAIEKKSGKLKRVRIPLPILKMATERAA
jgi:hypothetical protein